jgi:glycosyltransferase involved in cell wall biosynthesis
MPLVSVVMPAWNGERYIADAMRSVLSQTLADLELIVVNDGSTDSTLGIAREIAQSDARVHVIDRQRSGRPAFPRNDGIAAARGRYVSFLDCDDLYDPERTALLVEALDAHPGWVAAFHDVRLVASDGHALPGTYLQDAGFLQRAAEHLTTLGGDWYATDSSFFVFQSLNYAALHTQSVVIAADRLPEKTLRFDTRFLIAEDTDLWIRLAEAGTLGYLDRVLSSYRQHASSLMTNSEAWYGEAVRMHEHNYARIRDRLSGEAARRYRRKIAGIAGDLGYARYSRYDLAGARAAYAQALTWDWSGALVMGLAKACLPATALRRLRRSTSA